MTSVGHHKPVMAGLLTPNRDFHDFVYRIVAEYKQHFMSSQNLILEIHEIRQTSS